MIVEKKGIQSLDGAVPIICWYDYGKSRGILSTAVKLSFSYMILQKKKHE
jgi:hypothetical protein